MAMKIVILSSCFCVCKMRKFKISFKKVGLGRLELVDLDFHGKYIMKRTLYISFL